MTLKLWENINGGEKNCFKDEFGSGMLRTSSCVGYRCVNMADKSIH